MKRTRRQEREKKSIFRSVFIPLFLIMLLQAAIFYFSAVYGGVEESLSQNAADILTERLNIRRAELEAQLNNRCFALDDCILSLDGRYADYERAHGARPLADDPQLQIRFLEECADGLIDTLRQNEVNGVFLILNDSSGRSAFAAGGPEKKYGLCIRDIDVESNYSGREDLLLERSPSSIVEALDCSLDSWWEAWYTFESEAQGDYYYMPLDAAWQNPGADGSDLAYFSGVHRISGSDQAVVSYSIPLISRDGYPYGVVGVELTTNYLAARLPNNSLSDQSKPCYVLALQDAGSDICTPIVGAGALYTRCFDSGSDISCANESPFGGFLVTGRGEIELYGDAVQLTIYNNNNNPFEGRRLVLLAMAENRSLFAHIGRVKLTLLLASLICLTIGVAGILFVSRRFAAPITALAVRVRDMQPQEGFRLDRLNIAEIDQLVDAIEELNQNVSRNSVRTEFFSRMSHDMRTPMNAIISFSSPALLEGASEAVKDDCLNKIHASADYLLGLINEVLDITRIESNKTELHLAPVQAARLCDTVIPIIEKLAQKKGLTFESEILIGDAVYVLADSQHLDQIIMNLLSNAVKFTPAGGHVLLTAGIPDDRPEESVALCRIVVSDNGVGMSKAFMRNLYVPFEQEHRAREGTGLGLSITKKLVELMGGTIDCVSQKNVGTRFTVEIPLIRTAATEAAHRAAGPIPRREDFAALAGKRILVCEDNAVNVEIVRNLLEKLGMLVEVAEDGRAAVDAFAASEVHAYDAVLMDVQMPVMNGLAATRGIRALDRPDAASVPIIAMTANAFAEDVQACRDAGMNEHLAKPIDIRRFFDVLRSHLDPTETPGEPEP